MNKDKFINVLFDLVTLGLIIGLIFVISWTPKKVVKEEKKDNEDDYITNVSEEIFDSSKEDGFEFSTSPVVSDGTGGYRVEVNIKNVSNEIKHLGGITLIIKDENDKKIDTISSFQYMEFNPKDSMIYMIECDKDLLQENYNIEYRPSYVVVDEYEE